MIPHEKGGYRRADDPGEPSTGQARVSIADDEVPLLAELVAGLEVLEIGTGLGVSTNAMASTAVSVTTVDIDQWVQTTIWPTLPANVTCCETIPDQQFDAVFIDGDHGRHAVKRDVERATALCRPGGLLIAHDANYVGRWLGEGWTFLETTYGVATKRLP